MKKIVITGSNGFIGKNLNCYLASSEQYSIETICKNDTKETIRNKLQDADIIFHLAGANRPKDENEFKDTNVKFTEEIIDIAESGTKSFKFIYASSIQATLENPYGRSKLDGELILKQKIRKGELIIYRLPGVFGKWCKPNYNSVVATFCYNISRELPIQINDENHTLTLVYIDDVINSFANQINNRNENGSVIYPEVDPIKKITLKELSDLIVDFKKRRKELKIPNIAEPFIKKLYSTYLSYLPEDQFSNQADVKMDNRGSLFEILKSENSGQIFVSTTLPGITRGNHYHHTKTEKFIVIQGEGVIRFRKIDSQEIIQYNVTGKNPEIVDIPTGYTHNITNTGTEIMITIFWANEIFNPSVPDTYFKEV